uniref:Cytochrome P450 CYP82D175 n=1 Tax=Panax ginseng TaxID=4054 RepID=A0A3S9H6J5_PANGI|nr:cytochrome P450 CYP82D175 [Panax ginseng]
MDLFLQSPFSFVSGLCALLIFIYFILERSPFYRKKSNVLPQAGGALPIIGHLHLLGGNQLTHKTLGAMADKFGPPFALKLSSHKASVVSSWEMARECFLTHDRVFSTRPSVVASKLLGYNLAMFGFAPYDSYWREIRKIVTLELLSSRRIDMLKHVRASEVKTSIRELYELWVVKGSNRAGILVDMKQWFGNLTHNSIMRAVVGKRYFGGITDFEDEETENFKRMMRDFVYLFGVFVLSDVIPFLGWLDFRGYEKKMKSTAKELDNFIAGWLEEHKKKKLAKEEGKGDEDFMDVMLAILEDAQISGIDADIINKATCLNLILAGSDTTKIALTWALSLLLNNRHVLEKAQAELDIHVGKDRHVDESDIKNLVYLQAIVKETLRLYPPSPIIAFRAAMEDCTISAAYEIPAGTRLIVNLWKIHRDERVWPEPNEFKPERFLTSHKEVDLRGQHFEFLPFGSGRRACPGSALALQSMHLTLASLLHCYDITNISNAGVDMTESLGLTNFKATPLQVYVFPRHGH